MINYQSQKNPFLDRRPYVYAIMWTEHNIAYVGVRYRKACHPDDFWTKYFTSSNYVKEFREIHGEPDRIEIIDTFLTAEEAIAAEQDIISTFGLHLCPAFLNKQCQGIVIDPDDRKRMFAASTHRSSATRAKISASLKGRKRPPEVCAKISASRVGQKRKPHSDTAKANMSAAKKGKIFSDEHRANLSKANSLRRSSEETKQKVREAVKARWEYERANGIVRGKRPKHP